MGKDKDRKKFKEECCKKYKKKGRCCKDCPLAGLPECSDWVGKGKEKKKKKRS
jgi:hypothetical protein